MEISKRFSADEFLVQVKELVGIANRDQLSLNIKMKRLVEKDAVVLNEEFDASSHPRADISRMSGLKDGNSNRYPILLRVSLRSKGDKKKCSTIVEADSLDKFWQEYVSVLKDGMNNLVKMKKKKGRSKVKKSLRK
ncbi:HFL128Wp [Eremothecium sinecaudum]|uniref:HFL128Wp n=1 Tax=Eremothecium sinecaudum TaxID=45286 RepID=A0A0X8HUN9_9SACH|nr:HFL128Wp [Eremothecium sinecaudum]AMD21728.1 HFL128Wp [Eremothecium sinecaudum]